MYILQTIIDSIDNEDVQTTTTHYANWYQHTTHQTHTDMQDTKHTKLCILTDNVGELIWEILTYIIHTIIFTNINIPTNINTQNYTFLKKNPDQQTYHSYQHTRPLRDPPSFPCNVNAHSTYMYRWSQMNMDPSIIKYHITLNTYTHSSIYIII